MKRVIAALFCASIFATSISSAEARPRRHHHHHNVSSHHHHHHRHHRRIVRYRTSVPTPAQEQPNFFFSAFSGENRSLVARARSHIGETARQVGVRSTLWCSAFIRKLTKAKGVDDRAKSWLRKHKIGPRVGAIAVMGRRGGGHVGIVSGFTPKGDPVIISGNHNNRVRESVYPKSRIIAYVSAL